MKIGRFVFFRLSSGTPRSIQGLERRWGRGFCAAACVRAASSRQKMLKTGARFIGGIICDAPFFPLMRNGGRGRCAFYFKINVLVNRYCPAYLTLPL